MSPAATGPIAGRGERILVVEDEAGARQSLEEILAFHRYEVTAVADGNEALALPRMPAFDLLLCDLVLPGLSGTDVALALQARWPAMRVLLMSGYSQDEVAKHAVLGGQVRFLQKPFDIDALLRELRSASAKQDP